MLYREYGQTGKNLSVIAAGGMRFADPENIENAAEVIIEAAKLGINYFDTAPMYCNNNSQKIFGVALKEVKKLNLEYYVSTKCGAPDYDSFMKSLENSLNLIGVDHIDFMHSWGVNSWEELEVRKKKGAIKAMADAKEQGLISHIVCSSHMSGEDIAQLLDMGLFEGITLGFCAINFPFRMAGIQAAAKNKLGVVTMNPLAGGMIPQNADRFSFIKTREDQSILEAAIHFNLSHSEITTALIGFRDINDVRTAVKTLETFKPVSETEIKKIEEAIEDRFDDLCTTCDYCKGCPVGIPVSKIIEAYNYYMLSGNGQEALNRLKWHWGIKDLDILDKCTKCRQCEKACTQKLPILERFEKMKELEKELDSKE